MRWVTVFAFLLAPAAGQPPAGVKAIDPAKGRELLEGAVAALSTASLEIQVASARELGELYAKVDKKRAVEVLEQGFANALTLPDEADVYLRSRNQGKLIQKMALVDPAKALEMLGQLPATAADGTVKPEAYEKVVEALLADKKVDEAARLLETYGAGEYPFRAASHVMQQVDSGRRVILFGYATSAYAATPRGDFGELILKHWETLPREAVQPAVSTIVSSLLAPRKEKRQDLIRLPSEQGPVSLSKREYEVFKLLKVVKAVDEKTLAEILEKHKALREANTKLPQGQGSGFTMAMSSDDPNEPEAQAMAQGMAARMDRSSRIRKMAEQDPPEALRMAEKIKDADERLSAIVDVGNAAAEKDPAVAASVLTAATVALEKAEQPMNVALALMQLMPTVMEHVKEKALVARMAEKLFGVTERLQQYDRNKDKPNTSPRDVWPSTQCARIAMMMMGVSMGTDAIPLLEKWRDPELRLVAQIGLARAMLGVMPTEMSINISHSGK